jgi:hypothetical protein
METSKPLNVFWLLLSCCHSQNFMVSSKVQIMYILFVPNTCNILMSYTVYRQHKFRYTTFLLHDTSTKSYMQDNTGHTCCYIQLMHYFKLQQICNYHSYTNLQGSSLLHQLHACTSDIILSSFLYPFQHIWVIPWQLVNLTGCPG